MAGKYARKEPLEEPLDSYKTQSAIPARATRQLPAVSTRQLEAYEANGNDFEEESHRLEKMRYQMSVMFDAIRSRFSPPKPMRYTPGSQPLPPTNYKSIPKIIDQHAPHPLERHRPWLQNIIVVTLVVVVAIGVLLSASILQRTDGAQVVNLPGYGQVYSVQVGGVLAKQVQQTNGPITPKVPLQTGPYSVLGKPSVSVDFINKVLAAYNSPAAGTGQQLYDLGVKYGIDPAFALAFFQHESSFGKAGEANTTLSLGNLRCIPDAACVNQSGSQCQDGQSCYASFPTWEAGYEAWYKLIRNLYVAVWGLTTVDQIIPKYAPTADNNDETAYINSLKHELDTWHSGQIYT